MLLCLIIVKLTITGKGDPAQHEEAKVCVGKCLFAGHLRDVAATALS